MSFETLGLHEALLRTVREKKFTKPTPIQKLAIPPAKEGRDVLGCAQTGTGKTAAFALPILQRLGKGGGKRDYRPIRSLILAPTRELAAQIAESFGEFGRGRKLRHTVIFGGVNQRPQVNALRRGVDIVIATPGRLLDLIGQGEVDLSRIDIFVLDEADRMLDMGFIHDIRRIVSHVPKQRQTMLFSATMPPEIERFANDLMSDPVRVAVAPEAPAAETVDQEIHFVERHDKLPLLQSLLNGDEMHKTIVFTRTKHGADKVARKLERASVPAGAIHGNKSQNQRTRTLDGFRNGRLRVLVASDIAARGIDVSDISHVVNFDLPNEPETYVHRIGRTGRAGQTGQAISFCSHDERPLLKQIERLLDRRIPPADGQERPADAEADASNDSRRPRRGKGPRRDSSDSAQAQRKPRRRRQGEATGESQGERKRRRGPKTGGGRRRAQSQNQAEGHAANGKRRPKRRRRQPATAS